MIGEILVTPVSMGAHAVIQIVMGCHPIFSNLDVYINKPDFSDAAQY